MLKEKHLKTISSFSIELGIFQCQIQNIIEFHLQQTTKIGGYGVRYGVEEGGFSLKQRRSQNTDDKIQGVPYY